MAADFDAGSFVTGMVTGVGIYIVTIWVFPYVSSYLGTIPAWIQNPPSIPSW